MLGVGASDQLVDAAWWGFTSGRETDAEAVARARIPAHRFLLSVTSSS